MLWASNDSIPDFPNSVLNANGSKTVTATIDIPLVPGGTYYIISYADAPTPSYPNGYHNESDENNNTQAYPVSINPPPMLYLDNGTIKVGVNLEWGGAISEILHQGFNLIDNHDTGRLVQVAFYGNGEPPQ